jgi:hypothetical protein
VLNKCKLLTYIRILTLVNCKSSYKKSPVPVNGGSELLKIHKYLFLFGLSVLQFVVRIRVYTTKTINTRPLKPATKINENVSMFPAMFPFELPVTKHAFTYMQSS